MVKKATEYGAVEIWMNERVRRACGNSCADFVYGFLEVVLSFLCRYDSFFHLSTLLMVLDMTILQKSSKKGPEYWLLWKYEGESTLAGLLQSKDFPYNVRIFDIFT